MHLSQKLLLQNIKNIIQNYYFRIHKIYFSYELFCNTIKHGCMNEFDNPETTLYHFRIRFPKVHTNYLVIREYYR